MSKFICFMCKYEVKLFDHMKKHLMLKNTCYNSANNDIMSTTLDEKFVLSLMPVDKDGKHKIDKFENIKNIHLHKKELFELLNNIYTNKIKKCPCCNEDFSNYQKIKNHIIVKCFMDSKNTNSTNSTGSTCNITESQTQNTNSNNDIATNSLNNTNTHNTNTENSHNNTNTQSHNNTVNSNNVTNININYPVSFKEDWIMDHIDERIQKYISINNFMYTNLLTEILKNNLNQNIYLDKEKANDMGLVFNSEEEKYVTMKIDEIVKVVMEKLNKKLLEINYKLWQDNSTSTSATANFLKEKELSIILKYKDFIENKNETNGNVNNFLSEILDKNKEEAKKN